MLSIITVTCNIGYLFREIKKLYGFGHHLYGSEARIRMFRMCIRILHMYTGIHSHMLTYSATLAECTHLAFTAFPQSILELSNISL